MKQYKMINDVYAAADADGLRGRTYAKNEIIKPVESWQYDLLNLFLDSGSAIELKVTEPTNFARARTDSGHFIADNPTTTDINEAYVGGVAPKKKSASRKKTVKKTNG